MERNATNGTLNYVPHAEKGEERSRGVMCGALVCLVKPPMIHSGERRTPLHRFRRARPSDYHRFRWSNRLTLPHSSVGIIRVSKWGSNPADTAGEALLDRFVEELEHGEGSFRARRTAGQLIGSEAVHMRGTLNSVPLGTPR